MLAEYGLLLSGTSDWSYALHSFMNGPWFWVAIGAFVAVTVIFWFMR
ncbi:hypothetical protein CLV76_111120 [Marivita geojedonensis]|nr:hypothetical protein CLV76_111120 [Marivita geojedonensis]